jgi:pimeloyl-ACP methyl ester carboxylesterase
VQSRELKTDRGAVCYWIERHGDPRAKCIVFTHGLTADHSMFERQTAYFCREYTVITWDVPLHGRSRPYQDFSYRHCAEDLLGILDRESIPKTILVGMSMGGYPSQAFAARWPERVEGFVALDTTPFGLGYYSRSDIWWLKHVAPLAKLYPDKILRRSMAKSVSRTKYARDKMTEMLAPHTREQIIEQMDIAYGGFIRENRDVSFSFPVLILVGEFDRTGKVRRYCEAWSEKEGYPLHIIRNAAHFSNADNPEQVNDEIRDFIFNISTEGRP